MELVKNDCINCEDRGYYHCEKRVCRDCFQNGIIKDFIKNNGEMGYCNYCGKRRKIVQVEELMDIVLSGIQYEYEDANNYIFEDEYPLKSYTSYELLCDVLNDDFKIVDYELMNDISDLLVTQMWTKCDPYNYKKHDMELYSWHSFCELVKYRIRYVFYNAKNPLLDFDLSNPVNILDTIGIYADEIGLIKKKSQNIKLFRGRLSKKNEPYRRISDFAPPPKNKAKSNRMSAEGISMFYGAFDKETALLEIDREDTDFAQIASFNTSKDLVLLDLSKLKQKKIPSLLDKNNRGKRSSILFLKSFEQEIRQKITENENIEYVPTQIVTEYFRYVFKSKEYDSIDGLIYNSSQKENGYCVALFMNHEDFLNKEISMINHDTFKVFDFHKEYIENKISTELSTISTPLSELLK